MNKIHHHPLQNRVNPFGDLISTTARGVWMGNRGLIHNKHREIERSFRLKAWITCLLEFKGWHREVMTPGLYTELFFLDEATAFAAGHRPCAECRRADYNRFKSAWLKGNPSFLFNPKTRIGEIDEVLDHERMDVQGRKVKYKERLGDLPEGVFIEWKGSPYIIKQTHLIAWTPFGYKDKIELADYEEVIVLTPRSVVNVFRSGYRPQMAE